MGVRHRSHNYLGQGHNRCGAAILGAWPWGGVDYKKAAGLEEVEIDNSFQNIIHQSLSGVINYDRRYRLILDSIVHNGYIAYEMRVKDHLTGQIIYSISTMYSSFTHNYDLDARGIILATITDSTQGGGSYSNLKSYWTEATIAVVDP